tara:strand:- start:89 stop:322 length:234 start_codon:yes stop_codon:yes gene_type:complete
MKTIFKTNNLIELTWVKFILKKYNINFYVMDQAMSSVEGNISAIPVRILVDYESAEEAKRIINFEEKLLEENKIKNQ